MDNLKQEAQILKEFISVYERPEATSTKYNRISLALTAVGIIVAFLIPYFLRNSESHQFLGMVGLVICGFSIGLGYFLRQAGNQVLYYGKYTTPKLDAINERLNEIKKT